MSGKWITLTAVFSFGLVAGERASAQDFSYAAEPAKKKYDAKIEELRTKLATEVKAATADYAAKLDEQVKAATEKGDLDKVLIYRAEKEWIEKDKSPEDTPASLKLVQMMRAAFEAKKKLATAGYEKAAKAAQVELIADLDAIVKEETKAGRLESALKVRDLKQELAKGVAPPVVSKPNKVPAKEIAPTLNAAIKKGASWSGPNGGWAGEIKLLTIADTDGTTFSGQLNLNDGRIYEFKGTSTGNKITFDTEKKEGSPFERHYTGEIDAGLMRLEWKGVGRSNDISSGKVEVKSSK